MAKKEAAKQVKPTQVFNYIYIALWAIMPFVYIIYKEKVQDFGLFPRYFMLSLSMVISAVILFARKTKPLPIGLTMSSIAFFLIWHFAGYSNAYATSEFWATFSRNALALGYLLLTFQLLRNQLLSFTAIIRGVILFAAISCLGMIGPILQALTKTDFLTAIYDIRVFFTHKNFAASALLMSIPFLFLGTKDQSKGWSMAAKITLGLALFEIAFLRTRGVWIAFFAGIGSTVLLQLLSKQNAKQQLKWVGIGTGIFAVLIVLFMTVGNQAETILNKANIDLRFKYWEASVEMVQEHPVTGVGAGNWKVNFPKYGLLGTNKSVMEGETMITRPHNDMLWVLSEMGFPAWLALAIFQLLLLFICIKLLNHTEGNRRDYAMACNFGLIAFATYGLGEFPLERSITLGLTVLIAAEALRLGEEENILKKPFFTLPPQVATSLILALSISGLYISNARIKGERNAEKALTAYSNQQPSGMLKYGEAAKSDLFELDIYSNPMQFFTGLGYTAQQNFGKAETEFKDGLALSPYHINTLFQLGNIYKYQKKYDQALAEYDKSLEISPLFYRAQINKAEVYLLQNNTIEALKQINLISYKLQFPKYAQVGVEALTRFAKMPDSSYKNELQTMARKNINNKQAMWNEYLAMKKEIMTQNK